MLGATLPIHSRAALAALWLTGALAVLVLVAPPDALDTGVLDWLMARRTGWLDSAARAFTDTGASPLLFPSVGIAGLLVFVRSRRWLPGALALLIGGLAVSARLRLSRAIGDERPPHGDWLVPVDGFSFPSGHTVTSALVAGMLIWLLRQVSPLSWLRSAVEALVVCWAVLVGLSRLSRGPLGHGRGGRLAVRRDLADGAHRTRIRSRRPKRGVGGRQRHGASRNRLSRS